MTVAAGIDGYRKGWVAVVLGDGRFEMAATGASLAELVVAMPEADAIGIDIPIGLPELGPRPADVLARLFVGPRRNSVFPTVPREVWEAPDIKAAREVMRSLTGGSISAQTYALAPRVLEADAIAREDERIHEVHPEVSFAKMAGRHLDASKASWAGIMDRLRLLTAVGIELPDDLGTAGEAGVDDVLDAAAAAWSATRIAEGHAGTLPDDPTLGPDGHRAAIWY